MQGTHVVTQLMRKKSELMGRASAIKDELRQIEADIETLERAALLFAPSADVEGVQAKRRQARMFKRGELLKHILVVLREAGSP